MEEEKGHSRAPSMSRMSSSFSFQGENHEPTALERKMQDMRQRFRMLQLMEEVDGKDDREESPHTVSNTASPSSNAAAVRWTKLRKIIRSSSNISKKEDVITEGQATPRFDSDDEAKGDSKDNEDSQPNSGKPSRPTSAGEEGRRGSKSHKDSTQKLEKQDADLLYEWNKDEFFKSFPFEKVQHPDTSLPPIPVSDIELKFEEEAEPVKLEISRVPEEAVQEKKDTIEKALLAQQKANVETIKKLHTDVVWREDLARKRVLELEQKTKQRIQFERTKMIQSALSREKNLGQQFRRAREELEEGIRRQEAAVKEHFGRVLTHNEVCLFISVVCFAFSNELFLWNHHMIVLSETILCLHENVSPTR